MQKAKCEICGEEFKNLGVHKWQKHKGSFPPGVIVPLENLEEITVDVPTDKPLSELIASIKELLRPYQFSLHISYDEQNGTITGAEIHAGIQLRR